MFCTQCGTAIAGDAKFCGNCGAPAQGSAKPGMSTSKPTLPPPPIPRVEASVPQVRPWVRYWARMFDIYLASIVAGFAIGILNPNAFNEKGSDQLFALVVIFAWVFIEAIFLSTVGTTPGKWLFKTRIVPPHGGTLDYSTALSRSFKVWWRGLGIGFPLASLITLIVAHGKLTKNGITTWDRDDGFTITHERIGVLRVLVAIVFFTGFLLLIIVGNAANA
ncbi:Putative membrane protein/domain protein (modular protein) [uncultured Stenotrophomonas sp.]|uniref:Putative membrane protein/domain protein (Modular protein) n=1 Tax=uncultured Stenotrophomonas sp. TaxID=165438 RepID=A0A1Y5Q614_9GAMM|nr:Putative membrane protein/domain protein (modular protein) [uncultured Stenotrophomonas sp.]